MTDLRIARRLGWRLDWVRDLDPDEYAVIVEELLREQTPRGGDLEGE